MGNKINQNTMTTEKTAPAWFEMLKEPWRSQAIKASEEQIRISRIKPSYPSLSEALLNDFTWEDTPQEWLHWHKIHTSIERGETTYLADEHECKHCGVMTTQPDEECYKATSDTTDGWVKCSDRLPDNDREVLIYTSNDIVQAYCKDGKWKGSMLVRDNMNDGYVNDSTICQIDSHFNFVTHWRELPEPPTK